MAIVLEGAIRFPLVCKGIQPAPIATVAAEASDSQQQQQSLQQQLDAPTADAALLNDGAAGADASAPAVQQTAPPAPRELPDHIVWAGTWRYANRLTKAPFEYVYWGPAGSTPRPGAAAAAGRRHSLKDDAPSDAPKEAAVSHTAAAVADSATGQRPAEAAPLDGATTATAAAAAAAAAVEQRSDAAADDGSPALAHQPPQPASPTAASEGPSAISEAAIAERATHSMQDTTDPTASQPQQQHQQQQQQQPPKHDKRPPLTVDVTFAEDDADEYMQGMPQPTPLANEGEMPLGLDLSRYGLGAGAVPPSGRWQGSFIVKNRGLKADHTVRESFELQIGEEALSAAEAAAAGPSALHVHGIGRNVYGKFTLTGTYDAATGACTLMRIYYAVQSAASATPGGSSSRGRSPSGQQQKRKRPAGQPPTPASTTATGAAGEASESLAERRGRRSRAASIYLASIEDSIGAGNSAHHHYHCSSAGGGGSETFTVPAPKDSSSNRPASSKRYKSASSSSTAAADAGFAVGNEDAAAAAAAYDSDECMQHLAPLHIPERTRSTGSRGAPSTPLSSPPHSSAFDDGSVWRAAFFDEHSGEVYEGGWHKGKRSALGTCVYANGNMYEGEWRKGREHGSGVLMTGARRVIYDGDWVDGRLCGRGTYTFADGSTYTGDWRDNMRHGRGVYTLPGEPSARYEGEWRDNMRCGRGTLTWPDGSSYDGEWCDDLRHGRGALRLSNGFEYDGQWVSDEMEGRGTCIYADGQRYEGMFRSGLKDGRGTLAFANGAQYEGRFRQDHIDGQGMLRLSKPVQDWCEGDWMIPINLVNDIERIHVKAGFDKGGL